jgi:hypothetical protein
MSALPHFSGSARPGLPKLAAITFSVPSWIFVAGFVGYRLWDGCCWPSFPLLAIPGCICAISSLIGMTVFLIFMDDSSDTSHLVLWVAWAALPILLGIFYACVVWYSVTVGDEYHGYYWID